MTKSVLICDDSLLMRKMVADILIDAGWIVAGEATNGHEAVEMYQALRPTAVTMDIVMPGADGVYGMTKIIEFDPAAKIVVVSAINQTKLISEAIRKGAQDFIVKPFMPEQLQQTLQRCTPA